MINPNNKLNRKDHLNDLKKDKIFLWDFISLNKKKDLNNEGKIMKNLKELEETIAKAIKKVGARKENELCKYIPMNSGGYMHHFTLKKMKTKQPEELKEKIKKFIINSDKPSIIPPKARAARGSRKRRDQLLFSKTQLERMLNIAKLAGDKEIIAVLSPKKSLTNCKKDLIQAIRHNRVEQDLWNAYVESVQVSQELAESASFHS